MSASDTQGPVSVLDLQFQTAGTVAAFLVRTPEGPLLVETGPESLYEHLRSAVQAQGFELEEIRHVFVTHIHLDHAGAAWRLAQHGAKVYVHPKGAAHLAEPGKLMGSATRIYGDAMERLWGRMEPIPAGQVVAVEDEQVLRFGDVAMQAIHTPGHAIHHITWRLEDGLFTGDVGGIRIGHGPVIPPFPPPDIDLEAWRKTLGKFRALRPDALYPTHFGRREKTAEALDQLEDELLAWAGFICAGLEAGKGEAALMPEFEAWANQRLVDAGVDEAGREAYRVALPFAMNVTGLVRYWQKRAAP